MVSREEAGAGLSWDEGPDLYHLSPEVPGQAYPPELFVLSCLLDFNQALEAPAHEIVLQGVKVIGGFLCFQNSRF